MVIKINYLTELSPLHTKRQVRLSCLVLHFRKRKRNEDGEEQKEKYREGWKENSKVSESKQKNEWKRKKKDKVSLTRNVALSNSKISSASIASAK